MFERNNHEAALRNKHKTALQSVMIHSKNCDQQVKLLTTSSSAYFYDSLTEYEAQRVNALKLIGRGKQAFFSDANQKAEKYEETHRLMHGDGFSISLQDLIVCFQLTQAV